MANAKINDIQETIKIDSIEGEFVYVGAQSFDKKNRITVGNHIRSVFPEATRISVLVNKQTGDVLIRPMIEVLAVKWKHTNCHN